MKRHFLIIATAIMCVAFASCTFNADGEIFGGKTVKGDGNIVTRNFDVTDFNEISTSLSATVNFTVSDNYSCTVSVDENLLEYLDIKVDDDELILCKLQKYNNTSLRATEFIIEVTAPSLEEVNLAGSGTFNALSPLNGEKMEVNLAGSGDILFKEPVTVGEISMDVAGSGTLECAELNAEALDSNVAGSGDLAVHKGSVMKANASVAGSGDIDLACEVGVLVADVAGSGDIIANVNDTLEYSIVGSGDISYYGNAEVKGDKAGGRVKRIDAPKR